MLLESTSVSVTPREFTSVANGDMLDVKDRGDIEAIWNDGVFVYQVRQGRCIELRMENNDEDELHVWWDREEVEEDGRRYRNGSGARLSAAGVYRMPMFRMRGNAIQVAFSNDDHVVLLRMRFENVGDEEPVGGSGGAHVPALVHMQALLEEMRRPEF
jgi:hypothetical protein